MGRIRERSPVVQVDCSSFEDVRLKMTTLGRVLEGTTKRRLELVSEWSNEVTVYTRD